MSGLKPCDLALFSLWAKALMPSFRFLKKYACHVFALARSLMKSARYLKPGITLTLVYALVLPGVLPAQQAAAPPRYKLTIVDNAATSKRVKKGRVSSQAVVKVTDENDVPVAGVAVTFTIPSLSTGGAAFANGALTSVVTTNAAGVASTGFSAATSTSFSIGAAASVPGGAVVTGTVPVTTAAAAAAGAGLSAGAIAGIVAGVSAAAVAGVVAGVKASGGGSSGTISAPGGPTFGHP
jgi:hypothetical protein